MTVTRVVNSRVRLYGYKSAVAPAGDTSGNLQGAQFRDLVNAIAYEAGLVAQRYVGRTIDGRGVELANFSGDLKGVCQRYAAGLYAGMDDAGNEVDPGYVVDTSSNVNSPADLAAGNLKAEIGVRLAPTAEFVTIAISAGDAATSL